MPVRIVTDSSSNLDPATASAAGITVLPLHTMTSGQNRSTAGLSALELVAAYARQLERGNDDGVVAIHLSKELSSTWSNATTAAGVFTEPVVVVDTSAVGMNLGCAVLAAAEKARDGGDVEACRTAAVDTLSRCHMFLYLHRIDEMRRSGRMSAAATLMSTTLATRPILSIAQGKFEIAAKTRTQSKGMAKLAELTIAHAAGKPASVWLQQYEAREAATGLEQTLREQLPAGSDVHVVPQDLALAIHSGPGSLAVTIKVHPDATPPDELTPPAGKHKNSPKGMDFLSLLKNDPKPDAGAALNPQEQAEPDLGDGTTHGDDSPRATGQ